MVELSIKSTNPWESRYLFFNAFNDILVSYAGSQGVTTDDQTAIYGVLRATQNLVVSVSVCDKYSRLLNISNNALISLVVNRTISGLLADPLTAPYFTGVTPPGTKDFTKNPNALQKLFNGLVQFFGGGLGCSDGSISQYTDADLASLHQPLGITAAVSQRFNSILLGVTSGAGVTTDDNSIISGILVSLNNVIIAQGQVPQAPQDIPVYTGPVLSAPGDPNFASPSYVSNGVIAVVIIFAILCAIIIGAGVAAISITLNTNKH